MKTKNYLFYLSVLMLLICSVGQAQTATLSSGGNGSGSGGVVNYSIGQVSYTNETSSGGTISQGVQQPFEIFTLGDDNYPTIFLTMILFPNPTTSLVNLKINDYSFENLDYKLFDLNGRILESKIIQNSNTEIQLEKYAGGTYLLEIIENNKIIKTFKIIKNN